MRYELKSIKINIYQRRNYVIYQKKGLGILDFGESCDVTEKYHHFKTRNSKNVSNFIGDRKLLYYESKFKSNKATIFHH